MILFVIPSSFKGAYASGNWKDNTGISLLLESSGYPHKVICIEDDRYEELLDNCGRDVTDVVLYYSFWVDLLKQVRRRAPWVRLHVRTVNAEALQHWQRAQVTLLPSRRNLQAVYGAARLLLGDGSCRRHSDTLLGISEWDNQHYWSYLPGGAKVNYLPYYSPWPYLRSHVTPSAWDRRRQAVVCMAGGRDAIGRSMIAGFARLADGFAQSGDADGWELLLSPGVFENAPVKDSAGSITLLDRVDEPWDLLCSVRAVAVLTPMGYGMKTTVVDGLAAGCHVLVDSKLAKRLPLEVRRKCILIDHAVQRNVGALVEQLSAEPPSHDLNGLLRLQANKELSSLAPAPAPSEQVLGENILQA